MKTKIIIVVVKNLVKQIKKKTRFLQIQMELSFIIDS